MADILCLDTEIETVSALEAVGHHVADVRFGYRDGTRHLASAPHDFDLVVCDLRQPACFDMARWGPHGGNDNYKCTILPEDERSWDYRLIQDSPGGVPRRQFLHRLIYETQIERMNRPSPFGPKDVLQAIALGAVPAVIFLNPEWVMRTGGGFPSFFGLRWEIGETNATKFSVLDPLASLIKGWDPPLLVTSPVRCALIGNPQASTGQRQEIEMHSQPVVVDRVSTVLGQQVKCGKGSIWLLPGTDSNAAVAAQISNDIVSWTLPAEVPRANVIRSNQASQWDLFISHASEDKSFADELYASLTAQGVTVWYDSSILTIGDSLTKKIDEGLAGSRFGLVLLSGSFFSKQWPRAELDALYGLQMGDGRKRILPVWLDVDRDQVARFSPLLASMYASRSSLGISKIVEDILQAIRWQQ